jgi:hypothetical protein
VMVIRPRKLCHSAIVASIELKVQQVKQLHQLRFYGTPTLLLYLVNNVGCEDN